MSRRAPIVEDEFDDDTILPLPSHVLPNTGTRGPLIEEIHISDDEFEPQAGPASPPSSKIQPRPTASGANRPETSSTLDITPYKACVPLTFEHAKRPYGTGQRRVSRAKSLWWPLSKDIAEAASRLGLSTLHEVSKAHPRDWDNPGRVRVQWKKDGRLVNSALKTSKSFSLLLDLARQDARYLFTEKQLLEMICLQIQQLKPENIPKPPYNYTPSNPAAIPQPKPVSLNKGKQPAQTKSKSPAAPQPKQTGGCRVPVPPEPLPPLSSRISQYSPAISTGVLIETVKAGMNATESPIPGAGPTPGASGGIQKGKRKVVRVRG
ncbi:hypothetical protein C0993_001197 [Termitomyces sp. T159_Od127]|nr:hypothetical protein C0993_001197 [Termitomyces sp. T159_Od127]